MSLPIQTRPDGSWLTEMQKHEMHAAAAETTISPQLATDIAFATVDENTGEVILDDPDSPQAQLWQSFRRWASGRFQDSDEMLQKLTFSGKLATPDDRISCIDFCASLQEMGWSERNEELLFKMHCTDEEGIGLKNLKWLDLERRRQMRKEKAKQRAQPEAQHRVANQQATRMILVKFKTILKQTYGSYIRAWRKVLSPSDSMVLQRPQFFLALSEMGWATDARRLWKALGKGTGGFNKEEASYISIDELDPKGAETLAHFWMWTGQHFGDAAAAFRELDRSNRKSVQCHEFVEVLSELGFTKPCKRLFHDLSRHSNLVVEDLLFLDRWKPREFLLATPNQSAVDQFKTLLLSKYRSHLKAWRWILDTDNSNRCDWQEFQLACSKHVQFVGDVPGAWRALDKDLSGFITLAEIDHLSHECLKSFKEWATREFGSVKSAFKVFDVNGSSQVSSYEFKRSCRIYDFDGDANAIFRALDVERNYSLSIDDLSFLDEWRPEEIAQLDVQVEKPKARKSPSKPTSARNPRSNGLKPLENKSQTAVSKARRRAYTNMPQPERVWWNDLPCSSSWATPRKITSSKGNAIWCNTCKMRGFCSHVRAVAERLNEHNLGVSQFLSGGSPTPSLSERPRSTPVRSPAPRSPGLRPPGLRSPGLRAQSAMSWHLEGQSQLYSAHDASPQASQEDSVPHHVSSRFCASPDSQVQYMALCHFPMGSVSSAQATAALRTLASNTEILSTACSPVALQQTLRL